MYAGPFGRRLLNIYLLSVVLSLQLSTNCAVAQVTPTPPKDTAFLSAVPEVVEKFERHSGSLVEYAAKAATKYGRRAQIGFAMLNGESAEKIGTSVVSGLASSYTMSLLLPSMGVVCLPSAGIACVVALGLGIGATLYMDGMFESALEPITQRITEIRKSYKPYAPTPRGPDNPSSFTGYTPNIGTSRRGDVSQWRQGDTVLYGQIIRGDGQCQLTLKTGQELTDLLDSQSGQSGNDCTVSREVQPDGLSGVARVSCRIVGKDWYGKPFVATTITSYGVKKVDDSHIFMVVDYATAGSKETGHQQTMFEKCP